MSKTSSDILKHFQDDEIAHYGVLGMKWGVRKDDRKGSGRRRGEKPQSKSGGKSSGSGGGNDGSSSSSSGSRNNQKPNKPAKQKRERKVSNRAVRRMSNDEIRRRIERLDLETQYAKSLDRNRASTSVNGKIKVWAQDTTKSIVTDAVKKSFTTLGVQILDEAIGVKKRK